MIEIKMPDLGQTVDEMTIVNWHIKVGDKVNKGDVLLEVETDKSVSEVESFADGIVEQINYEDGDVVKAGEVIVMLKEID